MRLDQPAQAAAFVADPDAALRNRDEPVLLDEWQEVPAVLGAVKRAVDDDSRPGRFLLTGSVRADLETVTWPGTGRLVRLRMFGFALFVAERVPAWAANHLGRLVKLPKRYVVDASLMAASLDVTADTVLASGDLLGRAIDTFVVAQLRPEVALSQRTRLYHARTKAGREAVDVVVELPGGKLVGIEIKATAAPTSNDARHLRWLRAEHASRFVAGVVLHTGPDVIVLDDDIFAVPICAFWG